MHVVCLRIRTQVNPHGLPLSGLGGGANAARARQDRESVQSTVSYRDVITGAESNFPFGYTWP